MYVVGATQGRMFEDIRKIVPNHFLLVPGIGAQGGSLEEVCKYGMTKECGLIVNSSRAIIYADKTENFANVAAEKPKRYNSKWKKNSLLFSKKQLVSTYKEVQRFSTGIFVLLFLSYKNNPSKRLYTIPMKINGRFRQIIVFFSRICKKKYVICIIK